MPTFVAAGFDRKPADQSLRDRYRTEHREFLHQNPGRIICGGAMLDEHRLQCGSLYILAAETIEDVHSWLAQDPFVANGIYETLAVREVDDSGPWWALRSGQSHSSA